MVVTGVTFTTQTRIQESEQAKILGEMFAMKSVHYKRGKYHSFYRGLRRIPCCIEVQLRWESLLLFVFSKHLFLQRWSKWATPFVIKIALLSWYVQCKSTFIYLNQYKWTEIYSLSSLRVSSPCGWKTLFYFISILFFRVPAGRFFNIWPKEKNRIKW